MTGKCGISRWMQLFVVVLQVNTAYALKDPSRWQPDSQLQVLDLPEV